MAPHANVDTQEITEKARRELLRLLESVRGKKNLVVQKSLLGPIGLFVKFSTLQEYGIEKLFVVENKNVETTQKNIVFLARGEKPQEVQAVAELIKQIRRDSQNDHDFTIIWAPRRTRLSDRILEENGVLGDANILQCPLYFIALEPDVLSLELEDATADLYQRHDPTSLYMSAQAIMGIQRRSGLIPRILGKGEHAKRLSDLLLRLRAEEDIANPDSSSDEFLSSFGMVPSAAIDSLVIIDREVDFPTPLLTQLTYAGLLDETFSTRFNTIEVPTSVVGPAPSSNNQAQSQQTQAQPTNTSQKRKIPLDSSDPLYPELRDLNFALLGPTLNARARALQTNYESRHKADASISDLKSFVSKLPSYQAEQASLKLHTALAEEILSVTHSDIFLKSLEVQQTLIANGDSATQTMHERIEDLISRAAPLPSILRLLSLSSTLTSGLRPRDYDNLKRLVLHAYGFQHLLTFSRLEAAGLLLPRAAGNTGYLNPMASTGKRQSTDYPSIRKTLKLLVDDIDEEAQSDPAYVFSGYAPLSVRLVQCALVKDWASAPPKPSDGRDTQSPAPPSNVQPTGWKPFEDVLARIRGPTVDVVQAGAEAGASNARVALRGSNTAAAAEQGSKRDKTVTSIVFFVGGVTYAEIAALRLVGKQMRERRGGANRRLVIATTGIVNGDRLVGGAVEEKKF
ncbi:vacuolar sorting protein [Myriangium duriaei CBS 260.36]|uniref:Vacuolar sorting protein n=1 Tax=Myriangium duriaei CBS 260.36 TaxID=1168546 RepID=A0A9P4MHH6_9PEZI|nr:vacuolar sorting protein [Myriangium duriaei CBS 260.36]